MALWHSLLNPDKEPEEWHQSIEENGIKPEGGDFIRDNSVYFHKPGESVYDEDILNKPSIKVKAPESEVLAAELDKCSQNGEFSQQKWEENLMPYKKFDPEPGATVEYVVVGGVDSNAVEEYSATGPPHQSETEKSEKEKNQAEYKEIGGAAELFT